MTIQTLDSNQARLQWRAVLDTARAGQVDTVIERYGEPTAVVIPYPDYAELLEDLADLRAARQAIKIYEAWQQDPSIAEPWETVRQELINDGLLDG